MTELHPLLLLRRATAALTRYSFQYASEAQLHDGIAQALDAAGIAFTREHRASPSCRFDFWCQSPSGSVVIEVKIDGSMPGALRQVDEYVKLEQCHAVVVAATNHWARNCRKEFELRGKPIRVVHIATRAF